MTGDTPTPPTDAPATALRAVLVCDLADSTTLVDRLGDSSSVELLRRHDRLARDLARRHGGFEIDHTDGFVLLFDRPVSAVAFALEYQRALADLFPGERRPLLARVGIHLGEVQTWGHAEAERARGAKLLELGGQTRTLAMRLAALAQPGQILLSGPVHDTALRARAELPTGTRPPRWKDHGRWRFEGVGEPVTVYEVGEPGLARFAAPRSRGPARRSRPATHGLAAAIVLLGVVVLAAILLRDASGPAAFTFAARDWVLIADLENGTGEPLFESSLNAALQLGLSQSPHANVVPAPTVRQVLAEMRRDPDARIDRALGAELAQRAGARALILPSVVERGGRLLLGAELIDTDDGRVIGRAEVPAEGGRGLMPAVDVLVADLRRMLGEPRPSIDAGYVPLARATTANLDALRAYSLGQEARSRNDFARAHDLFSTAVRLDPEFALAWARLAINHLGLDETTAAREAARRALALAERLPAHERLYIEATAATAEGRADTLSRWQLLVELYPDSGIGTQNAGFFAFTEFGDCATALPYFARSALGQGTMRRSARYRTGVCRLIGGDAEAALEDFAVARAHGIGLRWLGAVDALATLRRYDEAERWLAEADRADATARIPERWLRRAALAADRGRVAEARDALERGRAELAVDHAGGQSRFLLAAIEIDALVGDIAAARARTREHAAWLTARLDDGAVRFDATMHLAATASWAARLGDADVARALRDRLRAGLPAQPTPVRRQALARVEAELALADGDPAAALAALPADLAHPLWSIRERRARALAAAGRRDEAVAAYRDLLTRRGAVFAEWSDEHIGRIERVLSWHLAHAALAALLGPDDAEGESARAALRAAWADGDLDLDAVLATRGTAPADPATPRVDAAGGRAAP